MNTLSVNAAFFLRFGCLSRAPPCLLNRDVPCGPGRLAQLCDLSNTGGNKSRLTTTTMANVQDVFGELSDEEDVIAPQAEDLGLRGFRWEPQRDNGYDADDDEDDEPQDEDELPDRTGRLDVPVDECQATVSGKMGGI